MSERSSVIVIAPPDEAALISAEIDRAALGISVETVASREALAATVGKADAVVLWAGTLDFAEAQASWRERGRSLPCVVVSRRHDDDQMRAVMRAGAADYVSADRPARLGLALERELARRAALVDPSGPHSDDSLLEAIVDSLPFVLFVKDAEELRIRVMNRMALDLAGASREDMIGKLDHEYLPKEQADAFMKDDREVLAAGAPRVLEEVARIQGVDLWFQTRKVPVVDRAGRRYVLGVTEDITERRSADEALQRSKEELEAANAQLSANLVELKKSRAVSARSLASYQQRALQMEIIRQQNEDLDRLAQDLAKAKRIEEERAREIESAARLKSEFLANFSHEIRTPLNGILGYCDILMREEGARLTPHGRRDLNVVKANAKALLGLINDILDLSKIEAGHVEVVRESVEIRSLIDECIATVRDYLKGKDVEIYAMVPADIVTVETDAVKLRQIVLNLLSNAAKFTETGEIVVDVKRDGSTLLLSVEDTGSGIPADQLPVIFEKFRQVDGSSTRKVGGSGLGLAIVRELCRVLGGSVTVTSTLGRGSVFKVRLAAALVSTDETTAVFPERRSDRFDITPGTTVLVVDDDPLIHQLLTTELEREGVRVLPAVDGVGALSAARQHQPAAIVLDMYLPKLDGWAVLAELKSDPALAQIPVIIISVEEQRARGFSLGAGRVSGEALRGAAPDRRGES
jgi:PAS domain S-box-containing protein